MIAQVLWHLCQMSQQFKIKPIFTKLNPKHIYLLKRLIYTYHRFKTDILICHKRVLKDMFHFSPLQCMIPFLSPLAKLQLTGTFTAPYVWLVHKSGKNQLFRILRIR